MDASEDMGNPGGFSKDHVYPYSLHHTSLTASEIHFSWIIYAEAHLFSKKYFAHAGACLL